MQEKECNSVIQTTLHSELNFNSTKNKWEADICQAYETELGLLSIKLKRLLTLNFEKQHKQ